jgi:HAD superfamily hydrolase (TIGR01490 family)
VTFACFDVDHTITRASTGRRLIEHGRRARLFSFWNLALLPYLYLHYRAGTIQIDRVAERIKALANRSLDELNAVAERCFAEHVRDDIMDDAARLIRKHQDAGDTVVLATSSLALIVRPLARELGIEHVVCTELEFQNGIATGRFVRPPCMAEQKLRCMTEFVESRDHTLDDVTFYSDSRLDIPLLREVGHPVAVNPDRGLRLMARREGWPVLKFS